MQLTTPVLASIRNCTKFMFVSSNTRFMSSLFTTAFISLSALFSCKEHSPSTTKITMDKTTTTTTAFTGKTDTATFANGCFWCTEAIFEELEGVISAESGYTGGQTPNPTYKEVCTGETGHAEALQIVYDPSKISFDELLEVFWSTHDPTTLNQQGADIGTQYRSGIFYHNAEQKQKAEKYKAELDKSGAFDRPIVTEITPFSQFYVAEDYHQQYFELNENKNPYCKIVIRPKLDKFRKVFKEKLKQH
jgi:peptide-methionine (S)-S-oxide reductase